MLDPDTAVLFGRVLVGESATAEVRLRNVGEAPLVVGEVRLVGADALGAFALVAESLPTAAIAPGAATMISVIYTPLAGAATDDLLVIASNDPHEPLAELVVRAGLSGPHLRPDPPLVDFGLVAGREGPVTVQVVNDGTEDVTVTELALIGGAEFTLVSASVVPGTRLRPGDGFSLEVAHQFDATGAGVGRVEIRTAEAGPVAGLELRSPPAARVGADLDVEPLVTVTLDGTASRATGQAVSAWRWTLVEAPVGSQTAVDFTLGLPQIVRDEERCPAAQTEAARPCFFPDAPGIYRFGLVVLDERRACSLAPAASACDGDAECCSFSCAAGSCAAAGGGEHVCAADDAPGCAIASVNVAVQSVRAIPEQALFVSVAWDGAADFDLHLVRDSGTVREWNRTPDDCFYNNRTPDWGAPDPTNGMSCDSSADCTVEPYNTCLSLSGGGPTCVDAADDPRLLLDVTEAFGPEAIGMKLPPADTYHIGVHYFPDEHTAVRTATVRIFVLGEERFPTGFGPGAPIRIVMRRDDFWYVGRVIVPVVLSDVEIEAVPISANVNPRRNVSSTGFPAIP